MYVKLPLKNLNSNHFPPYLTSIYTYEMINAPKMCGYISLFLKKEKMKKKRKFPFFQT